MVGAVPGRFGDPKSLKTYFEMARGKNALEMTKWFNTNYHYLVPEIESDDFRLLVNKPLEDYNFHKEKGYDAVPHLIGPYTFLRMSKALRRKEGDLPIYEIERIEDPDRFLAFMEKLVSVYREVLLSLKRAGCRRVHIEEPALVLDTESWQWEAVEGAYRELSTVGIDISLFTYYDSVSDYERYVSLPVDALHLDLVSNKENLENIKKHGFPQDKELIAGLINGRQPWRANLHEKLKILRELSSTAPKIAVANSCPLYHLPVSVEPEKNLPPGLLERLSFAKEKLRELKIIKTAFGGDEEAMKEVRESKKIYERTFGEDPEVRRKITSLREEDFKREKPYAERSELQRERLGLPLFPTTTIGS
ncbi:MAG TPA: 5-methyltetrahydropteroyltriglutamate--homocysteine S-methyltransferase, partial [Aquificaceae bacterium]|nr:5-methyltetrahydropteroyltriglutamate--homocysteine S-methyltransferase [Aquificaceae bacterium]